MSLLPAVERQERALRSRLQLQQGEDSDSEDEPEGTKGAGWGSKKRAYYEDNQVNLAPGVRGMAAQWSCTRLQT